MPERKFEDRLGGYVQVKDRIQQFYLDYEDGRLVTTEVKVTSEPDGTPRVWVEAAAYRYPDDPLPGRGWSWMVLPGTTNFTRGSELENTETSAWGRAIGALGIGIDKSIATTDEIDAKADDHARPPTAAGETVPTPESGLIGAVDIRAEWLADMQLRQTPEGPVIGFRIKDGRQTLKVQAHGTLAVALAELGLEAGVNVTCWGTLRGEEFTPKGMTRSVPYQVLRLERIHGATFDLPNAADPEPPAEAQSTPMFDATEEAAIDAALGLM